MQNQTKNVPCKRCNDTGIEMGVITPVTLPTMCHCGAGIRLSTALAAARQQEVLELAKKVNPGGVYPATEEKKAVDPKTLTTPMSDAGRPNQPD